jgi:hypothetical protein
MPIIQTVPCQVMLESCYGRITDDKIVGLEDLGKPESAEKALMMESGGSKHFWHGNDILNYIFIQYQFNGSVKDDSWLSIHVPGLKNYCLELKGKIDTLQVDSAVKQMSGQQPKTYTRVGGPVFNSVSTIVRSVFGEAMAGKFRLAEHQLQGSLSGLDLVHWPVWHILNCFAINEGFTQYIEIVKEVAQVRLGILWTYTEGDWEKVRGQGSGPFAQDIKKAAEARKQQMQKDSVAWP